MTLEQLLDALRDNFKSQEPLEANLTVEMSTKEPLPPQLYDRLSRLQRLGLLNGDVILSLLAQAPVDPIGLVSTLMKQQPALWVFSAIDGCVVRVLARNGDEVAAAIRVDILSDDVQTMARASGKLQPYQTFQPLSSQREPGAWVLEEVQKMCDAAVAAASREGN